MPNPTPLDALTPERLREIAANCRNVADQYEAHGDVEAAEEPSALSDALREEAKEQRQLAALCEAVAKAQEAMLKAPCDLTAYASSVQHGAFWTSKKPIGVRHPTLAAALGAVGREPEPKESRASGDEEGGMGR